MTANIDAMYRTMARRRKTRVEMRLYITTDDLELATEHITNPAIKTMVLAVEALGFKVRAEYELDGGTIANWYETP